MSFSFDEFFVALEKVAEKKIQEAMENGEFNNLPGKGKPIKLDDDSHIPPECRVAYRILKNAGFTHPEIAERKEIENICNMLETCEDEQEAYKKIQKLNLLIQKINTRRKTPVYLELDQVYYKKILDRIKINKKARETKNK